MTWMLLAAMIGTHIADPQSTKDVKEEAPPTVLSPNPTKEEVKKVIRAVHSGETNITLDQLRRELERLDSYLDVRK